MKHQRVPGGPCRYAHVLGNDDREAAEQAANFLLGDAWESADEHSQD
jgi:hypothetical protein